MNLWGEDIPDALLTDEQACFLSEFTAKPRITIEEMWRHLDVAWTAMALDRNRTEHGLARYYAHPVWILNGIFTATDPVSAGHRVAIAEWLSGKGGRRIADFGGGGGQLARSIAQAAPDARVTIVEPNPSVISRHRTEDFPSIRWSSALEGAYDAVIAQDVLEHLEDPVAVVGTLAASTREGGHAIFANCFHPVIRCHLPETFHLRHTFAWVIAPLGLLPVGIVPGAAHAGIFRRTAAEPRLDAARSRAALARLIAPILNPALAATGHALRLMRKLAP